MCARLPRLLAIAALFLQAHAHAADPPQAPALPPSVAAALPQIRMMGGGPFTFYGLSVYDGYLWTPGRAHSMQEPFALDLHYKRTLRGAAIADRSVDEIKKLGYGTAEQRMAWGVAMKRIFPDVADGDRITGVNLPGVGARFFKNGTLIGEVDDPAFAQAFFGIWLDPRTSRPDYRRLLLGQ